MIEQVMMLSLKSRGGPTHGRDFQEPTRHQLICTAQQCVIIHQVNYNN